MEDTLNETEEKSAGWTREELEELTISELRELTDAKSVRRDDLIQAILRTPTVNQPDKPIEELPRVSPPYRVEAPDKWIPKKEWLDQLANQYNIEAFVFHESFRAFKVYIGGRHADWITIEQMHKLFGDPIPPLRRSRMPQRPMLRDRIIKHID